jgi:hypothetical protein
VQFASLFLFLVTTDEKALPECITGEETLSGDTTDKKTPTGDMPPCFSRFQSRFSNQHVIFESGCVVELLEIFSVVFKLVSQIEYS